MSDEYLGDPLGLRHAPGPGQFHDKIREVRPMPPHITFTPSTHIEVTGRNDIRRFRLMTPLPSMSVTEYVYDDGRAMVFVNDEGPIDQTYDEIVAMLNPGPPQFVVTPEMLK